MISNIKGGIFMDFLHKSWISIHWLGGNPARLGNFWLVEVEFLNHPHENHRGFLPDTS